MTESSKNGDGIRLTQSGGLSNRVVTVPLEHKDQIGAWHKKTLVPRPGRQESGRGETRTRGLTDVNPANGNHVRNVILLVVESFNN
jgi:hypothetical protein